MINKPVHVYVHQDVVSSVSFKPNSGIFASGSHDKIIRLWNIQHPKVINWIETGNIITAAQFSTDGERLVSEIMILFRHEERLMENE